MEAKELSDYVVGEDGGLFYISNSAKENEEPRLYRVWGIAKHGLVHGTGSYLNKETYQSGGYKVFSFDKPTYEEIQRYYDNLNNLFGNGRNDR